MNDTPAGLPSEIDTNIPNIARVYDYFLGGAHNFASDRQLATMAIKTMPHVRDVVRLNRSFLRRAVQFMIGCGIRQFLDIGSGIPTVGNVHEIAQAADPECRVVYADIDRVAVAHSQLLLRDNDRAAAIQADIRDPQSVIERPETRRLLDFDEPIGVLNLLVWHFVPDDDDPPRLIRQYRDMLLPGSFLAITHATEDNTPQGLKEMVDEARRRGTGDTTPRSYEQVVEMFDGFELVEPGVVGCAAWRPGGPNDFSPDSEANLTVYAGVGRKPGTSASK